MDKDQFSDELKHITVDGLKQLGDWVHQAKDFAVEQAPLFAQEYAKWWTVSHLVGVVTWLVVAGVLLWIAIKGSKYMLDLAEKPHHSSDWYDTGVVVRVIASFACFVSFLVAMSDLKDAAKGYFAPRVVVVEGIRDIVGGQEAGCGKRD